MHENTFHQPKRVHPLAILPQIIKTIKGLILPWLFIIISQVQEHPLRTLLIGVGLLGLAVVFGVLWWLNFTYSLEAGELRIKSGILNKKRRFIPLERIQSVDLSAGVIFQVVHLVKVQVETAADSRLPEVNLLGIPRAEAEALQAYIQSYKTEHHALPTESMPEGIATVRPPVDAPLLQKRISVWELVIVALTSASIGLLVPILFTLQEVIDDLFKKLFHYLFDFTQSASPWQIAVFIAILFFLSALVSIARTLLKYGNFTLTRTAKELRITHGLLERRQLTIPLNRLQGLRIEETPVRQLLGFCTVHVLSGGYGKSEGQSTVLFPLLRHRALHAFLQEFVPEFTTSATLQPLPVRAHGRYLRRPLSVAFVLSLPGIAYIPQPWNWLAVLLIPLALLLGEMQYRAGGWQHVGDCLTLRFRHLTRTTVIIPQRKIQSRHQHQSLFQRPHGLYTCGIRINTAGPGKYYALRDVANDDLLQP